MKHKASATDQVVNISLGVVNSQFCTSRGMVRIIFLLVFLASISAVLSFCSVIVLFIHSYSFFKGILLLVCHQITVERQQF